MKQRHTRILIGAGSFPDAVAALEIARRLSRHMRSQLGGLLIEEGNVTTVCQLPNQRVISASGAFIMAPSGAQVRTLNRADARAFRQMLADVAKEPSMHWTFEQQSGDLIECSINVGRTWDMLILGHREIHPVPGKVVFLGTTSAQADAALELATTLADNLGTGLLVFSIGHSPIRGLHGHLKEFPDLDAVLSRLARTNVQAVVIDLKRGPVRTKNQLREVVRLARCPVVVLGASSIDPALEHSTQIPPVQDRAER